MAETTQTSAATAAAQNQSTRVEEDTLSTLKSLEKKLEALAGPLAGMAAKVMELSDTMVQPGSQYFNSMASVLSSSMMGIENERRVYEEAQRQNEESRKLSTGASPERGQAGFWQAAFAPHPTSQADAYTAAFKAAFSNSEVLSAMKKSFGIGNKEDGVDKETAQVIKAAIKGNADDRTFGEKALDKVGLGGINTLKNWWKDRDIRKEEKETAKDEGQIKRDEKQLKRLRAQYRKMKSEGANDEDLEKVRGEIDFYKNSQKMAAERIRERKNDDLTELGDVKDISKSENTIIAELNKVLTSFNNQAKEQKLEATAEKKDVIADSGLGGSKVANVTPAANAPLALPAPESAEKPITGEVLGKALNSPVSKIDMSKVVDAEVVEPAKEAQPTVKDFTGDKNEPVELGTDQKSTLGKTESSKEAADIQRKLDTQMRPDFYQKGTEFFKKGNDGSLFDGLASKIGGGLKSLGGGLLKGGLYAALGTAALASVGHILKAGKLVGEWWSASKEAHKNINEMYDKNKENNEKMKKGYNDDMRNTLSELMEAEKALSNCVFFDGAEKKRVEELKKKYEEEQEKLKKFLAAADAAGIDRKDTDKLNEFKKQYDQEQAEKAAKAQEAMASGGKDEKQQSASETNTATKNGQKPAAGSMDQKATPNAETPGVKVEPEKVETAAEQSKRMEDATYSGTKRALTDDTVKQQNEECAKIQGQQINESLVGRK